MTGYKVYSLLAFSEYLAEYSPFRLQINLSGFRIGHTMGTTLRIFIVNDDDSLQRIALAKYERMRDRDPRGRLPEYAGKRIRYALVFVDLENRQPVEILRVQYSYLYFDDEGLIEADHIEGDLYIDDGSGTMNISDITGNVVVWDGSGSINIKGVEKDVEIKSE